MSGIQHYIERIHHRFKQALTTWGTVSVDGTSIGTSATTTLPPHSRFVFIEDGNFLNVDEVDSHVTHDRPLYNVPVGPGQEWIVHNQSRNFYIPGFDGETGIGGQFAGDEIGGFVPEGVTLEVGLGGHNGEPVGSAAIALDTKERQGAVMHIEENSADVRIYKDGNVAAKVPRSDWIFDPFSSSSFEFDYTHYCVIRLSYDLYGAGDFTFQIRMRDENGEAFFKTIAIIGIQEEPALNSFNLHSGAKIINNSDVTVNWQQGPIEYHNNVDDQQDSRQKADIFFNVPISTTVDQPEETVIGVYRIPPDYAEAPVQAIRLHGEITGNDVEAIIQNRLVHKDYLDFGGVDPTDDSNWVTPRWGMSRESALQRLDVAPGTVDISTFTDIDGQEKVRGVNEQVLDLTSTNKSQGNARRTDVGVYMNELQFLVLLGSHSGTDELRKARIDTQHLF